MSAPNGDAPAPPARCTAFDGHRRVASGSLAEAALAVRRAAERGAAGPLLIFDDATGRVVDVDTRGSDAEVVARLSPAAAPAAAPAGVPDAEPEPEPRRRGRPRLGVVAREVTLLPRHWEWLNAQPGGASVALRRLVEEARRAGAGRERTRAAREAAYRFTNAVAGDLPGFEEATRALFAGDRARFGDAAAGWPRDVREHAVVLGFPESAGGS
jgi:hypothetical protein